MQSVRYLFSLLLLLCVGRANAVLPAGVSLNGGQHCSDYKHAVTATAGSNTVYCTFSNVVAGDVMIFGIKFTNINTFTVSGTETPTCPASLQTTDIGGNAHILQGCYLTLASSHATFTLSATVTSFVNVRQGMIEGWEFAGLGAVDTASRTAVNAKSTSFTTAANNEFAFTVAHDLCNQQSPSGNNNAFGQLFSNPAATQDYRILDMTQTTGTAGSFTSAWTSTNSSGVNVDLMFVVAFAITGGHPQSAVYINQESTYLEADVINASQAIYLQNTLNGSKAVVYYHETGTNTARTCTISTGETCTCLAGSYITHSYSAINYGQAICYGDLTSTHALVEFDIQDPGNASIFDVIQGQEVVGLQTGADTASAAGAAALTVNYTTLAANEWTYCGAGDGMTTFPPNQMTTGGSFIQNLNSYADGPGTGSGQTVYVEGLTSTLVTAGTSGTCSYAMASSSVPLISVASFATIPSTNNFRNHSNIL